MNVRKSTDIDDTQTYEREFKDCPRPTDMNETRHIAAEIHDVIVQELAGISLMLAALRTVPQAKHVDIQKPLEEIGGLMAHVIASCRRVSEGFGGFLLSEQGLTAALLHYAGQFDKKSTHLTLHGRDIPTHWLDETTAYHLFSIGREAISNAFRHSRAKAIHVTCDHVDGIVRLIVEDNGVGLGEADDQNQGIGLSIMEFRARSIGAELTIAGKPSGGLRVQCSVARHPTTARMTENF